MDLQEVAAIAGAQYVLMRLRTCHPEWSVHDLVTTEPQARLTQNFYADVESAMVFATNYSRREVGIL